MSGEDGADMPSAETLRGRDDGADIGSRGRPGGCRSGAGWAATPDGGAASRATAGGGGRGRDVGGGTNERKANVDRVRASRKEPPPVRRPLPLLSSHRRPPRPRWHPQPISGPRPSLLRPSPPSPPLCLYVRALQRHCADSVHSSCACPDSPRTILLATVFHSASYYIRVSRMSCCTFPKRPTPCRNTCENCSLGERKTHRNLADDIRDEQAHRGSPAWWATRRLILMNLGLAFTSARAPSSPLSDSRAGRARHRATDATNASSPEGHRAATGLLSRVRHVTRFFVTGPRRRPPREAYKARATHKI